MLLKDILRIEREKLGLTQSELADKVFVDRKNISKYENGHSNPTLDTLVKLADILDCTTDYLLGRSEYRNGVIQEIEVSGKHYKREIDKDHITEFTSKEVEKILKRLEEVEQKLNKM